MNPSLRLASIVGILILSFGTAAAALTQIEDSPDRFDEPNLLGVNPFEGNPNPSVLETLYGETNLRRVDDARDVAFVHTGVEARIRPVAKFAEGGYVLTFHPNRIVQPHVGLSASYVLPTTPNGYHPAIAPGTISLVESGREFLFQFHLTGYSDPALNSRDVDLLVTFEIVGNNGRPDNVIGNYVLCWEGTPNTDRDYQDVVFEISGVTSVPEPASVIAAILGMGGVARFRRFTH